MPGSGRSPVLTAVAILVGIAGATFFLQGLGVPIGRSFMIGDVTWTWIGLGLIVIAVAVLWRGLRRS